MLSALKDGFHMSIGRAEGLVHHTELGVWMVNK